MASSLAALTFTVYFAVLVLAVVAMDGMPGMDMDPPASAPSGSFITLPSMVVGIIGFLVSLLVLKERI
ncbi:hypothetical protein BVC80_1583g14 [Macleaya cordata]|uniref:Arabinogalactan peptide n=1 Tax=Macleaya cordata TaxID=56857 RepID=A0A200QL81_MACCD|nr:hypothetical protein BVC80_1583g14 [Macleaya cordata]